MGVHHTGNEQLSFREGDLINLKRLPAGEGWGLGEIRGKVLVALCCICMRVLKWMSSRFRPGGYKSGTQHHMYVKRGVSVARRGKCRLPSPILPLAHESLSGLSMAQSFDEYSHMKMNICF